MSCVYPKTPASRLSARGVEDTSQAELDSSFASTSYALSPSEGLFQSSGRAISGRSDTQNLITGSIQSISDSSPTNTSFTAFSSHTPRNSTLHAANQLQTRDFSTLELTCPINVDDIRNRWLNTYVPLPGQRRKDYPASITAFLYRVFKSYTAVTIRGREIPPFVHSSQVIAGSTSPPLSSCLSLVRICENPLPGSENVTTDVLQREMNNIYEQRGTYDDMALLAAFQAYMIYCMVLFFYLDRESGSDPSLRQAMMNLQELACSSSRQGLVCIAEEQRARPKWEAWIVAEAKRRTLFAMYLFDSILSTQDGLPTYLGTELYGLPAPANKYLWKAHTRSEWERAYNIHLADWVNGGLCIHELWPIPADMDESGVVERRSRVDQWLGYVDEFGTMLYAVTSCTHGG